MSKSRNWAKINERRRNHRWFIIVDWQLGFRGFLQGQEWGHGTVPPTLRAPTTPQLHGAAVENMFKSTGLLSLHNRSLSLCRSQCLGTLNRTSQPSRLLLI